MAYIDDILVLAETEEMARDHTSQANIPTREHGVHNSPREVYDNPDPGHRVFGMVVDSHSMELRLPRQKEKKLRQESSRIT